MAIYIHNTSKTTAVVPLCTEILYDLRYEITLFALVRSLETPSFCQWNFITVSYPDTFF